MLEREKMFKFNRVYLLLSFVFSMSIPLLVFEHSNTYLPLETNVFNEVIKNAEGVKSVASVADINSKSPFLSIWAVYFIVAFVLFIRFAKNLFSILERVSKNQSINYKNCKLILLEDKVPPHSFWSYIFLNKDDYHKGRIDREVLIHEYAHVLQKHSLDVLFLELLQVACWFNPFIFFYKKAVLLNHEFLADEAVIKEFSDIKHYQKLLLETAQSTQILLISSDFNYLFTKKRLIMMTKSKSFKSVILKQIAIVLVFGISIFIFSNKIEAQNPVVKKDTPSLLSNQNGIDSKQLQEYQRIVAKGKNAKGNFIVKQFSETDVKRMEELFLSMSNEQQIEQEIVFRPSAQPLEKTVPTAEQFESFKDEKIYGVWVDEKRIRNSDLNKYTRTDFDQVYVSRLSGKAKEGRSYSYQVDLMTKSHFATYSKNAHEVFKKNKYAMRFRSLNK